MSVKTPNLAGQRILIVEDEVLLAHDVCASVAEAGATVTGPFHKLEDAYDAATDARFEAAILDVDIAGKLVFPVADLLEAKGIPFVFHTARPESQTLRTRYTETPICGKPAALDWLLRLLSEALPRPTVAPSKD
ncbi:MAG: response regulator [Pseudomonadota bacterium]